MGINPIWTKHSCRHYVWLFEWSGLGTALQALSIAFVGLQQMLIAFIAVCCSYFGKKASEMLENDLLHGICIKCMFVTPINMRPLKKC